MSLLASRKRHEARERFERDYREMKAEILRSTRSILVRDYHLRPSEDVLDECYNAAWHALFRTLSKNETPDSVGGFLVKVCVRRAIDEVRKSQPGRRVDAVEVEDRGTEPDLAAALDRRRMIREFMEGLRDKLTDRECRVVALCWIEGRTRPEAAKILKIAESRVQKIMDAATPKIAEFSETIRAGGWCDSEEHDSLMRAYALYVLEPGGKRHQLAERHLDDCPACRRLVLDLRNVAALVPPVWIPVHGATGAASTLWEHLNSWLHGAWHHHISAVGPHVVLAKSAAAAGAGVGTGSAASGGAAAGGGASTGGTAGVLGGALGTSSAGGATSGGLFAGAGAKLGLGVAVVVAGGALAVGGAGAGKSVHHRAPVVVAAKRSPTNTAPIVPPARTRPAPTFASHTTTTTHARTRTNVPTKARAAVVHHATKRVSLPPDTEFLPETPPSPPTVTTSPATTAVSRPSGTTSVSHTTSTVKHQAGGGAQSSTSNCAEFTLEQCP